MKRIISILGILTSNKTLKLKIGLLLGSVFLFMALPASAGINKWTSGEPEGGYVNSVAISPNFANDSTVFAGTDNGVYISTDGGSSWN
jgi:hypothetical protein